MLSLTGCDSISGDYRDALGVESGRSGVTYCSTRDNGPYVAQILTMEPPGDLPVEFREVDLVDANMVVEFFVVNVPADETIFFGASAAADLGGNVLEKSWAQRQELPGVVHVGSVGGIVALVPGDVPDNDVRFINDMTITAAVDGREMQYQYRALRMNGSTEACERFEASLES